MGTHLAPNYLQGFGFRVSTPLGFQCHLRLVQDEQPPKRDGHLTFAQLKEETVEWMPTTIPIWEFAKIRDTFLRVFMLPTTIPI